MHEPPVKLINQFSGCQSREIGNGLVEAKTVRWTVFSESRSSYAAHAPVRAFPKNQYSIYILFCIGYCSEAFEFFLFWVNCNRFDENASWWYIKRNGNARFCRSSPLFCYKAVLASKTERAALLFNSFYLLSKKGLSEWEWLKSIANEIISYKVIPQSLPKIKFWQNQLSSGDAA